MGVEINHKKLVKPELHKAQLLERSQNLLFRTKIHLITKRTSALIELLSGGSQELILATQILRDLKKYKKIIRLHQKSDFLLFKNY